MSKTGIFVFIMGAFLLFTETLAKNSSGLSKAQKRDQGGGNSYSTLGSGSSYSAPGGGSSNSYSAPAPDSSYGAPAPVSSYGAPAPVSSYGAPAPASSYGAPAPASSYGAPAAATYGPPAKQPTKSQPLQKFKLIAVLFVIGMSLLGIIWVFIRVSLYSELGIAGTSSRSLVNLWTDVAENKDWDLASLTTKIVEFTASVPEILETANWKRK